jgi:hypothetical protein
MIMQRKCSNNNHDNNTVKQLHCCYHALQTYFVETVVPGFGLTGRFSVLPPVRQSSPAMEILYICAAVYALSRDLSAGVAVSRRGLPMQRSVDEVEGPRGGPLIPTRTIITST